MAPRNEESDSQTPHPEQQIYSQLAPLQFIKMETVKQGQNVEPRSQITTLSSVSRNDESSSHHAEQQQYLQHFIKMEAAKQHEQQTEARGQVPSLPTTIYGSSLPQQIIRYESPCAGGPSVDRYAATAENGKELVMIFNPDQSIISESDNKKTFVNLGSASALTSEFMHTGYQPGGYLQNQLYLQNNNQQFILKNDPSLGTTRPSPYTHSMTYETTGTEGAYWNGNSSTIEFPIVRYLFVESLY